MFINVIGGGLAGSEAAWQIAERGHQVRLYEMRPEKQTDAHHTGNLAELVCSNSLGSKVLTTAGGLLKAELELLGSLIIEVANQCQVPAGGALAVDRQKFSELVTARIANHPNITVIREECTELPEGITIIATGPLSSPGITKVLQDLTGENHLYFYDAAAPIITGDSIDYSKGFWAARYNRGTADYFNCPLTKEEYEIFYQELVNAEVVPLHEGIEDDLKVFEGCIPIEVLASRGPDTLRYGPLRPVGLEDAEGNRPYAVVQLRLENTKATLFNLVGFQTRLKWGEQQRVFRLIPALKNAEFVRFGVMHRNTFINSPAVLKPTYQFKKHPQLFLAGQISGVEGYVESVSSGLVAGINACRLLNTQLPLEFPEETMIGALARYITLKSEDFQPMNANFGILPPLAERVKKKQLRKEAYSTRALEALKSFITGTDCI
ncbi:MAG: FADH(2)-oxidizing methylenetetrahydrofolate--tRNA-(uracil(54)-C(5))-methyltransferase TrmFO [Firmicutes bacterium]|nr:FADH(2)-oxidizing methylenetetrahydrofolate--tRNA-(uracil(54)-C(5))-methyltransferase TrmFO [Bacillota bacterium]